MSIALSDETQKLIESQMQTVGIQSPDKLVQMALQTLGETLAEPFEELDKSTQDAIEEGQRQYERGEYVPASEVFDLLYKKYSAMRNK